MYLKKQMGFSLIEILVSVFLVGFALLALVAMQIKTHAGVREAENLTIVAMAVDSLAEGMRANPKLTAVETIVDGESVLATKKSWSEYYSTAKIGNAVTCADPLGTTFSKGNLAIHQMCEFNLALATLPSSVGATKTIVDDKITVKWKTGKGAADIRTYEVSVK